MTEPANPAGPFTILERIKIAVEMLLQIRTVGLQQSLIEIALHKTVGRNIESFADVPAMIDADSGEIAAGEECITQMRRLRSLRIITDTRSILSCQLLKLRRHLGSEELRRK